MFFLLFILFVRSMVVSNFRFDYYYGRPLLLHSLTLGQWFCLISFSCWLFVVVSKLSSFIFNYNWRCLIFTYYKPIQIFIHSHFIYYGYHVSYLCNKFKVTLLSVKDCYKSFTICYFIQYHSVLIITFFLVFYRFTLILSLIWLFYFYDLIVFLQFFLLIL